MTADTAFRDAWSGSPYVRRDRLVNPWSGLAPTTPGTALSAHDFIGIGKEQFHFRVLPAAAIADSSLCMENTPSQGEIHVLW